MTRREFQDRVKYHERDRGLSFGDAIEAALKEVVTKERERVAKIAEERTRYSPYPPGDRDLGWKEAARVIESKIRSEDLTLP